MDDVVLRAARWAGIELDSHQRGQLSDFGAWLGTEAATGGGLGPNEQVAVSDRHLADSLTFAGGRPHRPWPSQIVDLGSGVGLPAIPLAIAYPQTRVVAVERSQRRCRLIGRATRMLDLPNLEILATDIIDLNLTSPLVVSRAALPPDRLRPHLIRLVCPGGVAVVGGSRVKRPSVAGYETMEIPPGVLDRESWLLIMEQP